jgi:prepilin peptidase CpaA
MSHLPPAAQVLLMALAITAAVYDLRFRRIPNWLVLSGLLLGIGLNTLLFQIAGLRFSGLGAGLALLVYVPLYVLRAMGAGDVKLMAAVGAIVGPWNWLGIFLLTALAGGVIAILLLVIKGRLRTALWNAGYILREMSQFRAPYLKREELDVSHPQAVTLPHGSVIGLGCIAFLIIAACGGLV